MIKGVTPARWAKITALDVERQQVQDRIAERSRKHHQGIKLNQAEMKLAAEDAMRYIEIEDEQWALLGIKKPKGDDNVPY